MNDEPLLLALCECEFPGPFCSGVPGILAAMEHGRLAPGAVVERCDQCRRFESDEAARKKLAELGLADACASADQSGGERDDRRTNGFDGQVNELPPGTA